jgi:hypothetical protein
MASDYADLPKVIGEALAARFQEVVEQPLPPLILQLLRKLREKAGGEEGTDAEPAERPRRMKADLFLPGARSDPWRDWT